MDEEILKLLERAVRLRSSINERREKHKRKQNEIINARNSLFTQATEYLESSPAMDEFHRQLDLLDKQEFELHDSFKKFLKESDVEITRTVNEIAERKFGPDFDLRTAL